VIARTAQAIAFLCLVSTGAAVVQVSWLQRPAVMCPEDVAVHSLPVYQAAEGRFEPPKFHVSMDGELSVTGGLPHHANEPGWMRFRLGRVLSPDRYIVSGLMLGPAEALPSDVTVRGSLESTGDVVPITFREHRASTPQAVTGYLYLLDGEPVANPALAAVRRAIRAPLSPPAAVTGIAMGYWQSGGDIALQKAEISYWLARFLVDIQASCTP